MKKTLRIISSLIFTILILGSGTLYFLYTHNFQTVIAHDVYRSRQLGEHKLNAAIDEYHLQSIINLRGAHPEQEWYKKEMRVANNRNIKHYDFPLQSKLLPPLAILKQLTMTIDQAPKPLLIHCESGVDRTGLASMIALLLADDKDIHHVQAQISLRHFVLSDHSVGRQFLVLYQQWLMQNKLTTSRTNFLKWLAQLQVGKTYPD